MKYFTLDEFIKSNTASVRNIDNTPSAAIKKRLEELVNNILDPLREAWGSGIKITSGYRCPKLNSAVGGAKGSAHMSGYAADTKPVNGKMKEYQEFVKKFLSSKAFDQMIIEYPKNGVASWIHIGYKNATGKQRKLIFTIR